MIPYDEYVCKNWPQVLGRAVVDRGLTGDAAGELALEFIERCYRAEVAEIKTPDPTGKINEFVTWRAVFLADGAPTGEAEAKAADIVRGA